MQTGDLIKKVRLQAGLTQAELAERLGVTPQAISQYERGVKKPKYETIRRIADAVGCHPLELIPEDDVKHTPGILAFSMRQMADSVTNIDELISKDSKERKYKQELLDSFGRLNEDGKITAIRRLYDLTFVNDYCYYAKDYKEQFQADEKLIARNEQEVLECKDKEQDYLLKAINEMTQLNAWGKREAEQFIYELSKIVYYQRPTEPAQTAPSAPDDKEPAEK